MGKNEKSASRIVFKYKDNLALGVGAQMAPEERRPVTEDGEAASTTQEPVRPAEEEEVTNSAFFVSLLSYSHLLQCCTESIMYTSHCVYVIF